MKNLLKGLLLLFALAMTAAGCYTQLGTTREGKEEEPSYSEREEYNADEAARYDDEYDPYWSARRTFYFYYYYPSFTGGYLPCDPWYWRAGWYYTYYDPFWTCGTYFPPYYAGWVWWGYPIYPRWWYPYGWGYGGVYAGRLGHGTTRTIGVTRTTGDTPEGSGRGVGSSDALPTGYRKTGDNRGDDRTGAKPPAGTRISTGRSGRGDASATESRGSREGSVTRGGNTRSGSGPEATRGGEVRTPSRLPAPSTPPPSNTRGDDRGGRSGGGRSSEGGQSYSPPAHSSPPPSAPPASPSSGGGRNPGGRGGRE